MMIPKLSILSHIKKLYNHLSFPLLQRFYHYFCPLSLRILIFFRLKLLFVWKIFVILPLIKKTLDHENQQRQQNRNSTFFHSFVWD